MDWGIKIQMKIQNNLYFVTRRDNSIIINNSTMSLYSTFVIALEGFNKKN